MENDPDGKSLHDVARLQQMIRTTMRALAASTLRAYSPSSTQALITRVRSLNDLLAERAQSDSPASIYIRDSADRTRAELAGLANRVDARENASRV